jgi:hypothetical protein
MMQFRTQMCEGLDLDELNITGLFVLKALKIYHFRPTLTILQDFLSTPYLALMILQDFLCHI